MSDEDRATNRTHENSWMIGGFLDTVEFEIPAEFDDMEDHEKVEWLAANNSELLNDFGEYIGNNGDYQGGSEQELYDAASYMGFVRNQWLLHFSDSAYNIWKDQRFNYGIEYHDYARLALSTHYTDAAKQRGGFNFAYDTNDNIKRYAFDRGRPKYGKEAVLFKGDGIKIDHYGDEEPQVIFDGKQTTGPIIYVEYTDNGWTINSTITGQKLIESDDIESIAAWVDQHYAQYRKHLTPK